MSWFSRADAKGHASDPAELLAWLLRAAQQDEGLRRQVLFVATAPDWHRESLVCTALEEMARRGESEAARRAFAVLATPGGAAAVRRVLARE
jgi:hypothetical protein